VPQVTGKENELWNVGRISEMSLYHQCVSVVCSVPSVCRLACPSARLSVRRSTCARTINLYQSNNVPTSLGVGMNLPPVMCVLSLHLCACLFKYFFNAGAFRKASLEVPQRNLLDQKPFPYFLPYLF
jgi:hypothetical protein